MNSIALHARQMLQAAPRSLAISSVQQVDRVAGNFGVYAERAVRLVLGSIAIALTSLMALVIVSLGSPTLSTLAYIATAFAWAVAAESMFEDKRRWLAVPVLMQAVLALSCIYSALSMNISRDMILGYLVWVASIQSMFMPLGVMLSLYVVYWAFSIIASAFTPRDEDEKVLVRPLAPELLRVDNRSYWFVISGFLVFIVGLIIATIFVQVSAWFAWLFLIVIGVSIELVKTGFKLNAELVEAHGIPYSQLPRVVERRARWQAMSRRARLRYVSVRFFGVLGITVGLVVWLVFVLAGLFINSIYLIVVLAFPVGALIGMYQKSKRRRTQ